MQHHILRWVLMPLLLILSGHAGWAATVALDEAERTFLANHPVVTIGVVSGNEPYSLYRNGEIKGFSVDVLRAIEKRTGLRFELRAGSWSEIYNSFRAGRLDAIDAISLTEERRAFTLYTEPYHVRETVLFENADEPLKGYSGFDSLPRTHKVGIIKDIYYKRLLQERGGAEIVEYQDYADLMKSLAFGWLDAVATGRLTGEYLARENHLSNVRVAGPLRVSGVDAEDYRIGVRRDLPVLHGIIAKGLKAIPAEELARIELRWRTYRGEEIKTAKRLDLTAEEKAFIEQHPVLKVGVLPDYAPFSFTSGDEVAGFSVALLDRIAQRTGLRFEPVVDNWARLLQAFRLKDLDVIANISYTEERGAYTLYSEEYYRIPNVVFVRGDLGAYEGLGSLRGRRVGIARDVFFKEELATFLGEPLVEFDAHDAMMRALSFGRVDAVATSLATGNDLIKKLGLVNVEIAGEMVLPGVAYEDLRFGVRTDMPAVQRLIDKALASLPLEERLELENRWLGARAFSPNGVRLSADERAYLEQRGPVRVCVNPDWMPYEGIDAKGGHAGMSSEFMALLAKRGGMVLSLVPTSSWHASRQAARERQCDVLPLMARSDRTERDFSFSKTYLRVPMVIATAVHAPFLESLDQAPDKPVGVVAGYGYAQTLRARHPHMRLTEVASAAEGLARTRDGELFGYVGPMGSIGYEIQKQRVADIKIGARLPDDLRLAVAVRSDEPRLLAVVEKLVDSVDETERQQIASRWLTVDYAPGFDYALLWKLLGAVVIVLLGFAYWNRKLNSLNRQLAEANARLRELSLRDPLTGLHNRKYLDDRMGDVFGLCQRNALNFSIAVVDVDHFKDLNDRHGHPFGDACLRRVGEILMAQFQRQSDGVVRYGGEEFVIFLCGEDPSRFEQLLERLRERVEATCFEFSGVSARITISAGGYSAVPGMDDRHEEYLAAADAALYAAKRAGRNRVVLHAGNAGSSRHEESAGTPLAQ